MGAVAAWCVLAVLAGARAAAYTVDCNHEYTDCDSELDKISKEIDDAEKTTKQDALVQSSTTPKIPPIFLPTRSPETTIDPIRLKITTSDVKEANTESTTENRDLKGMPNPRLLNLNVEDLQSFANALHNKSDDITAKKNLPDLSDVNLDIDEEDESKLGLHEHAPEKETPDKFYANLQAPFHDLVSKTSEGIDTCNENGIIYRQGDHMNRGCDETCECMPSGAFECSPRCKHPYIRKGRRLNDPLCFESPVDECCSILACATGTGDMKTVKLEVCRHENETYPVGAKFNIGCEKACTCERNGVMSCNLRCKPIHPSDKCINVQDPMDACCEVQICDVSQDVHEEEDNVTNSTTPSHTTLSTTTLASSSSATAIPTSTEATTKETPPFYYEERSRHSQRPLVLAEPIGSIKILQNNSVQVNLMQPNNSDNPVHLLLSSDGGKTFKDIELKYSNLILNLEGGKDYVLKTKETDTKFNFTITSSKFVGGGDDHENIKKIGCHQDGQFYAVGEEFHIGCTELCECTGDEKRECAALECPNHVGLELVSKGCVRWAPNPPAQPPNCCPRTARCLSDGTCYYNSVAIPNWTEVPIHLTGCERRCFCENGELDCQEVCSPLPELPPPTLRCPLMHHPAAVNISDEDCCKQWSCVPNGKHHDTAEDTEGIFRLTYSMPTHNQPSPIFDFVTAVAPVLPTITTPIMPNLPITPEFKFEPTPITVTDDDFYKHLEPFKTIPKLIKKQNNNIPIPKTYPNHIIKVKEPQRYNVSVFNYEKLKINESSSKTNDFRYFPPSVTTSTTFKIKSDDYFTSKSTLAKDINSDYSINYPKLRISESKMDDLVQHTNLKYNHIYTHDEFLDKLYNDKLHQNNSDLFSPFNHNRQQNNLPNQFYTSRESTYQLPKNNNYFQPTGEQQSTTIMTRYILTTPRPIYSHLSSQYNDNHRRKPITLMRSKDVKIIRPIENKEQGTRTKVEKHVLTKTLNPYETVLHRDSNLRSDITVATSQNTRIPVRHKLSALNLDQLMTQMVVESETNKNKGRSAEKMNESSTDGDMEHSPTPDHIEPFLPTVPPENYPPEDLPDYEQNNIHRPVHSLEPVPPFPGLPIPNNYGEQNKKLTVISIQADSPTSIKMLFGLPPVLVGLRGSVDLRYTDKAEDVVSRWNSQVFAPADEVLSTSRLEFRLTGLKPSTIYKIRGKLYLHNLPVEPESEVYTVRTQDAPTMSPSIPPIIPVEGEKRREIDSKLTVMDVNDTAAHVSWRHFVDEELQYIDAIQVRYRPVGTPIYSMTELLHHSRSMAELKDLRPGTKYEASLVLVPPPRSITELHDPGRVEFTTQPYIDPYNWTVTVEARAVGSEAAEVTWRGIPVPAERWVRVYRAAHACDQRKEYDAFRLATRDMPPAITLTGLQPNTRCRVWLELFLTNGKVKTSNVLEINTKSLDSPEPIDNVIEASVTGGRESPRGDYYGALVVVGVVAALGALTSLLLLLVVVRRHRPRSVPITPVPSAPRESSLPPYDNPAYKLELQQETMNL